MVNNNTTVTQKNEVKELVVDAHFVMKSFEADDDDGKTEKREYLSFELIDAFNDEDFRNIALKAKWDKYEGDKLVRPDRVFDYMKFYAKKALRSAPEVPVKVTIKAVKYKSKKTGVMVTYPAMFAEPTFEELADERSVEVVVKGASKANIFGLLASKALGIKFTPRENPDEEDIGL